MVRLEDLTVDQLKEQLITADYGGKEYKKACLEELIKKLLLKD